MLLVEIFVFVYNKRMKKYLFFFVSWLVPGLGHLLNKRYFKALTFFISINLMFFLGIFMQGKFYDLSSMHPLLLLGFIGDLGNGILFLIAKFFNLAVGNMKINTFNYGTTYLCCAGMLNFLIAFNAYDLYKNQDKVNENI